MTTSDDGEAEYWEMLAGVHRLLARLAGRMPDDWVAHVRSLLPSGDLLYVPDTIIGGLATLSVEISASDVTLLRRMADTFAPGHEPMQLAHLTISDSVPAPRARFFPVGLELVDEVGRRLPAAIDLTGGDPDDLRDLPERLSGLADLADRLADFTDQAMMIQLTAETGLVGIWRVWRYGPASEPPKRVFLVEVGADTEAWSVAYEGQRILERRGEDAPQVEVWWSGDELAPYQRAALDGAALLWAAPGAGNAAAGVAEFRGRIAGRSAAEG